MASLLMLESCGLGPVPRETARLPRVGILAPGPLEPAPYLAAFREGLREQGYVEGRNVTLEQPGGPDADAPLATRAAMLVDAGVDVIVAIGSATAVAARQATASTPIVAVGLNSDLVRLGLVASLARPGANVTGLLMDLPELAGKQLEILNEAAPGIRRVAVLWNPQHAAHPAMLAHLEQAAAALGVELIGVTASAADEFGDAFAAAVAADAQAIIPLHDPTTFMRRASILDLAAATRLPAMYDFREWVDEGGLLAYGPNLQDAYRRAARYVDRVLRGARPADLPIEQPGRFDLVVNLRTSQALGLTIAPSVLMEATDVIQ